MIESGVEPGEQAVLYPSETLHDGAEIVVLRRPP